MQKPKFFYYDRKYLPTSFDNSLSIVEKLNQLIKLVLEIDRDYTDIQDSIKFLDDVKEDKKHLTKNRKLSPDGNFTGQIHGRNSFDLIKQIFDNREKLSYLINQFSDGQTGLIIDGGFFSNSGVTHNYNGGVF